MAVAEFQIAREEGFNSYTLANNRKVAPAQKVHTGSLAFPARPVGTDPLIASLRNNGRELPNVSGIQLYRRAPGALKIVGAPSARTLVAMADAEQLARN